jgi:hypothetical protein
LPGPAANRKSITRRSRSFGCTFLGRPRWPNSTAAWPTCDRHRAAFWIDWRRGTMIHVVKPNEAKQRNSSGVAFDLLAVGPQSIVTKMHYRKENVIAFHSHPNEQTGYILSGRVGVLTRDSRHELVPATPTPSRPTSSIALRSLRIRRRCRCSPRHGKISADILQPTADRLEDSHMTTSIRKFGAKLALIRERMETQ